MPGGGRKIHGQYVYVIQHELGPVKIGRSRYPGERLQDLQIATPFELKLRAKKRPNNPVRVERFLHNRFRLYRMRGEWFDIPADERYFEIPGHVDEDGNPDVEVPSSPHRHMNDEWADAIERFLRAMKVTKYHTSEIKRIRNDVQAIGHAPEVTTPRPKEKEPPRDRLEVVEDTPDDQDRCSQCGHVSDIGEDGCPTCGSAAHVAGGDPTAF